MFKGRIVSRSNINGKVHTFQKDFDNYEDYAEFIGSHPEYDNTSLTRAFDNSFGLLDSLWGQRGNQLEESIRAKYLPEGISLDKYEERRAQKARENQEKENKRTELEGAKKYLEEYLKDNKDEEARKDLETIEKELKGLS